MRMSKSTFSDNQSTVTAEACAWIAQLETGELSKADMNAFREWIGRSPKHAAEIKQLAAISNEMNVLTGMALPIDAAAKQHSSTVSVKRARPGFALGLAFSAAVLALSILFVGYLNPSIETFAYRTAVGESQTITLPDGSIIQLNTNSSLEVAYDKNDRKIRLISGEAYFDVAPSAARPFWVYADDHLIRVVGTAFLVSLLEDEFELMVTEGRVELAVTPVSELTVDEIETNYRLDQNQQAPPRESVTLIAGQSVSFTETIQVAFADTVSDAEQRRELSWQEGLHDFSNTSLEEIVQELSRYNGLKYEFRDPELRDLKFGGVFRIGETQPLFDALASSYGIQTSYLDDQSIQLSRSNAD